MKEVKDLKPMIIQPNTITMARYEFTQTQKDFMYHFIEKMNRHMSMEKQPVKDLFGNVKIELNLRDMVKSDNYTPMIEAIKDLQKRPIQYKYIRENSEYEVSTHLVATMIHKKGSGKVLISTTEESMDVLLYIGAGFTAYNLSIALSLPSTYAKRMYELCCRWKDKGFCRMTIKEFRKMMMIENKFKNHADMDRNVLALSERILTEQADWTYSYTYRKENGSKAYNWIELNIVPTSGEKDGIKGPRYSAVYNILYSIYWDGGTAMLATDFIADKDNLKKAEERLRRLKKDIDSGKIKPHGIGSYVNKVLMDEFDVPEHLLLSKEEKKKREKAKAKLEARKAMKIAAEKAVKEKEEKGKEGLNAVKAIINKGKAEARTGEAQSIKELFHRVIE